MTIPSYHMSFLTLTPLTKKCFKKLLLSCTTTWRKRTNRFWTMIVMKLGECYIFSFFLVSFWVVLLGCDWWGSSEDNSSKDKGQQEGRVAQQGQQEASLAEKGQQEAIVAQQGQQEAIVAQEGQQDSEVVPKPPVVHPTVSCHLQTRYFFVPKKVNLLICNHSRPVYTQSSGCESFT